jgi:stage V sporulation protein G
MEVTEVKIFPVQVADSTLREDRLKAYVSITFDHCFVVRDLKVINGDNGLFVAMPSKKRKDGTYRDTAHPLNNETRQMIESIVLAEYHKEVQKVK